MNTKQILKHLVEIPSVLGDYEANKRVIDFIEEFTSTRGLHVSRHEYEGYKSLIATTRDTKTPRVFLVAHVDVVPADPAAFTLIEKDGKYYGRGVFDMKFAAAAFLKIVDDIQDNPAKYDFGVMIVTDEEAGGPAGVKRLLEAGYSCDVAIVPDIGDTPGAWKVERSAKGGMPIEIVAPGISSHGSRPWLGDCAISKVVKIYNDIEKHFAKQTPDTNTLAIREIKGGDSTTKLADTASIKLDIRILSEADRTQIEALIQKACDKFPGTTWQYDIPSFNAIADSSTRNIYVDTFVETIRRNVKNYAINETTSLGASDARFFVARGIPAIVAGPPGDGCHSAHEYINQDGLEQMVVVTRDYLDEFAKAKSEHPAPLSAVST